jgi:DNA polymerase-1
MIDVYQALQAHEAQMLVQVHDELVVMVKEEEADKLLPVLVSAMGDGVSYEGIPLKVSCHSARSWAEAKGK